MTCPKACTPLSVLPEPTISTLSLNKEDKVFSRTSSIVKVSSSLGFENQNI